jgi:hypothetical protein
MIIAQNDRAQPEFGWSGRVSRQSLTGVDFRDGPLSGSRRRRAGRDRPAGAVSEAAPAGIEQPHVLLITREVLSIRHEVIHLQLCGDALD